MILDDTLIPTDRIAAVEPYYSRKHRKHGMNVQVTTHPDGTPPWCSRALPGRTHDLTAARAHGVMQACLTRQILLHADRAHRGANGTARTPYYGRDLPEQYAQFNQDHARQRALAERAAARLKQWSILRKARRSTHTISQTVAAVHTLEIAWRSA